MSIDQMRAGLEIVEMDYYICLMRYWIHYPVPLIFCSSQGKNQLGRGRIVRVHKPHDICILATSDSVDEKGFPPIPTSQFCLLLGFDVSPGHRQFTAGFDC